MVVFKVDTYKKFLLMIKNKVKTIDFVFPDAKHSIVQKGDEIIYKNAKETITVEVKGVMYFNSVEEMLSTINTKNMLGSTLIKSTNWFNTHYPNSLKKKVILYNF